MKFIFLFLLSVQAFASLTLEEKVGQLLMVHFKGEVANEDAKTLIEQAHVGGFIYYNWANGLKSRNQISDLSDSLQSLSPTPLLIAIDQEGGLVTRLQKGFTQFSGNAALGRVDDTALTEEIAFAMGLEMRAVGINMNLAPVVDINSPGNPVIGIRSFGDTSEKVTRLAKATLSGFKKAGLLTSLKHFPGHGAVTTDPHEDLPVVCKSEEELFQHEFIPFADLGNLADTIMTAHILLPWIDPNYHATHSYRLLTTLLKQKMNYKGAIISDSLIMKGALKNDLSFAESAIAALNAGCDILLLGGRQLTGTAKEITPQDVLTIHQALVNAVNSGKISQTRLNEAVQKISTLKSKIQSAIPTFNPLEHEKLAKQLAKRSVKVIKPLDSSISANKVTCIVPDSCRLCFDKKPLFYKVGNAEKCISRAKKRSATSDLTIFFSYNAWKDPEQLDLYNSIVGKKAVVTLCDPNDNELFKDADAIIETLSPTSPSIQAALELLKINL